MRNLFLILVVLVASLVGCGSGGGADPVKVVIKSPLPGATVSGTVPVNFDYEEAGITVNSIDVRLDGLPVASTVYKPKDEVYTLNWASTLKENGEHTLQVTVIDSGWKKHFSPVQKIVVANRE